MRDLRAKDSGRYNVRGLCVLFGKSKQAYYQYDEDLALGKAAREEFALGYIRGIRARDPGIGGVKLWHMYRKEFSCDGPIGRDHFLPDHRREPPQGTPAAAMWRCSAAEGYASA